MLAVTLALGVWQLQRLTWKQDILASIEQGEARPPVPLTPSSEAFRRVVAEGRFLPSVARYGAEVRSGRSGGIMGAHLLNALERPGSDPVIVDRGWAPLDYDAAPPSGVVKVEGYIRPPEKPIRFGATDDPVARRFYALDPAAIGAALGLAKVAPFTLVVTGAAGTLPEPATSLPRPPNNHLVYAITWFGLAAALTVIFAVYARQTLRQRPPP